MQFSNQTEAKLHLQTLFTIAPTHVGVSSKTPTPLTGFKNVSASNAAPSRIFTLPNQRKVVMSATASQMTMTKNQTPLFGAPQPVHRVTTDDLLDMHFPLKSLTNEGIQKSYQQKMQGKTLASNQKIFAPKQRGIDIDSLLDAKYPRPSFGISTDDMLDMKYPLKSLTTHEMYQKVYAQKMQMKTMGKNQRHTPAIKAGIDMDSLLDAQYPKPAFSITTDDMLDIQNPQSLTTNDMYAKVYQQKMEHQRMAMNPKTSQAKQPGTDIDSLLDAQYPKPAFTITTDDMLDMQNLKSLSVDEMYTQAYSQKMENQKMSMNPKTSAAKQVGTDIDSLLDATYVTPTFRIETDDLLDQQKLTTQSIDDMYTQAYVQKAERESLAINQQKKDAKQVGIDIDSMLDATYPTSDLIVPANVFVSEVNYQKASADAKDRILANVKRSAAAQTAQGQMQGNRQVALKSGSTMTMEPAYTIDQHESITQRDFEFLSYEI